MYKSVIYNEKENVFHRHKQRVRLGKRERRREKWREISHGKGKRERQKDGYHREGERETRERLTKTQTTMVAGWQWLERKELIYDTSDREF